MYSKRLINAASGREPCDIVLKNCRVLNVFTGEIIDGDIGIAEGRIAGIGEYKGKEEKDLEGRYVVPGFINSHVHVESSMVTPQVYSVEELRHGTSTIITDPHEIVNVGGADALIDILNAADECPVNYYIMLPSCVPCTEFEHSGAVLDARQLRFFINEPEVLGLGEMMNAEGVINNDRTVSEKIKEFSGMIIDGHAPMYSGKKLNAYACAGINTDHESVTFDEALEKLRCGIAVLVREGSACKDLEAIIKGVVESGIDTSALAFCTDDKHLADIRREGTIRSNIKKAISLGLEPAKAFQMATINAARIYGLKDTGAVACGYKADIVVLDSLEDVEIADVYKDGVQFKNITEPEIKEKKMMRYNTGLMHSVNPAPLADDAFDIPEREIYPVIELVKNQIITKKLIMTHEQITENLKNGSVRKIAVIERHHSTGNCACAYITGYGLSHGAVATTVAHDSHNIIVIGDNDSDMHKAVEQLKKINGGYTIICDGKVAGSLPLEFGGLMSTRSADEFIPMLDDIIKKAYELGVDKDIDPFITLSFAALPVIPEIRITDRGLFDVTDFRFIEE